MERSESKTLPQVSALEAAADGPTSTNTRHDECDMNRMGKKQELRRNFRFISMVGFLSILQSTWESSLLASSFGLLNGGTAGIVWLTFVVWVGFLAMIASLAEAVSMAPTAGGQYHYVSEFAPENWEKPLSYITGWCCCLGWIAGVPATAQILVGLLEGMILLVRPESTFGNLWQTTLVIYLVLFLCFLFNIYAARYLPMAETGVLGLHVLAFLAIFITLWSTGSHTSAHDVFFRFKDGGGWGSDGLSVLVGISSPLWFFIGPDAGSHMSEEIEDASLILPQAMMWSTFVNGILGLLMLITFCFCIPDVDAVINTTTYQPVLQVIYNMTGSTTAACVLGTVLCILTFFCALTNVAAASRQCWAFARDKGFPFSSWIAHVDPVRQQPINALYVTAIVSFILAALNFGSDVAFNAIVSVSNAALVFSYLISIGCVRLKRLRGEPLLPRRWSLGRYGAIINDFSLVFLALSFAFSFFPENPLVGDLTWAADLNWSVVMFTATCLLALAYYHLGGRNTYVPPVSLVKKE